MVLAINIGEWLLQQAPVIVVMGVVIWWLAKGYVKSQQEKEQLSKDVIKLATLWEEKADKMSTDDQQTKQEILGLLREIKGFLEKKD